MNTNWPARLNAPLVLVVAVISLGVVAEGAVIVTHLRASSSSQAPAPADAQEGSKQQGVHPCNHGFYVSQAAHAKKGGGYVKQVAQSDLGKNGDCSAPLPAPASGTKSNSNAGEADGQ